MVLLDFTYHTTLLPEPGILMEVRFTGWAMTGFAFDSMTINRDRRWYQLVDRLPPLWAFCF